MYFQHCQFIVSLSNFTQIHNCFLKLTPTRDLLFLVVDDIFPTSFAPPALSKRDCRMSTRAIN